MLWISLGLLSALLSTIGAVLSERSQVPSRALASWFRLTSVIACLPFVTALTLPTAWEYWALVIFSALIMGINDVVIFNAIKSIGAGPTSRFRRTSILITFILWLIISPSLVTRYVEYPIVGMTILATHIMAVIFALRLKQSETSWAGLKMLWFPILAASLAPIISKLSFDYTSSTFQGVFSYIFIQSTAVLLGYWLYATVRNGWQAIPNDLHSMAAGGAWKAGAVISGAFVGGLVAKHYAYSLVENPAYISVLLLTDTLWLLLYHRLAGVKDKTDVASGMGIVGCAAALILIQIFFE